MLKKFPRSHFCQLFHEMFFYCYNVNLRLFFSNLKKTYWGTYPLNTSTNNYKSFYIVVKLKFPNAFRRNYLHSGFIDKKDEDVVVTGELRTQNEICCEADKKNGLHWQIPYVLGHIRNEIYNNKQCEIVEICFSKKTIDLMVVDKSFYHLVLQTTHEAIDNLLGKYTHSLGQCVLLPLLCIKLVPRFPPPWSFLVLFGFQVQNQNKTHQ